uniref:Uncharacterized protein n=1 Tax=Acrobeloides nanus TaxID=290746 RepID=A0A914EDR2_9BILA
MPRKVKQMNKLSSISNPVQSPIAKVTNLIRNLYHKFTPTDSNKDNKDDKPIKWTRTYEKLLHLKEELERKERLPGAKTYNLRMYDLVLGHDKPTLSPKESRTPKGLLQMAMNMVESVRSNKAVQETGNVKFLSPRFAPLMPDKTEAKSSHMSPTILAFYEEKYDNKSFASIPSVLKATGMSKTDRDNVLELLMDVSGATKHVGDALNLLDKLNFFGVKIPEAERHLGVYENIRPDEREEALWARIERIAMNRPDNATLPKSRRKRQISLLSPVVLAPYMFTPVFGLTVLGPVILSPSLFSPLIANPAVLSPYILSPGVPMPEILSPYVLCPYILSPLALAPFVLTPYVLSPNIVNPYALSPVILSPFVLSPDILSPAVLGGPILSPNVGSPSVLTEGFLTANVLSPSFLS